jgi:hypothetical protein
VVILHRVQEAVGALVGSELVHEQIWSAQLQLIDPVLVVLLVHEADARTLHAERVEHHARPRALQYQPEQARSAALGLHAELVLAVGHLDRVRLARDLRAGGR